MQHLDHANTEVLRGVHEPRVDRDELVAEDHLAARLDRAGRAAQAGDRARLALKLGDAHRAVGALAEPQLKRAAVEGRLDDAQLEVLRGGLLALGRIAEPKMLHDPAQHGEDLMWLQTLKAVWVGYGHSW